MRSAAAPCFPAPGVENPAGSASEFAHESLHVAQHASNPIGRAVRWRNQWFRGVMRAQQGPDCPSRCAVT